MKSDKTVRVRLKSDERLNITKPEFLEVSLEKPVVWGEIRQQAEAKCVLKSNWSASSYALYDWRMYDANGKELTADTPITEDVTVYARSNYTRFEWEGTAIVNLSGLPPRGKIIIPTKTTEIRKEALMLCSEVRDIS